MKELKSLSELRKRNNTDSDGGADQNQGFRTGTQKTKKT